MTTSTSDPLLHFTNFFLDQYVGPFQFLGAVRSIARAQIETAHAEATKSGLALAALQVEHDSLLHQHEQLKKLNAQKSKMNDDVYTDIRVLKEQQKNLEHERDQLRQKQNALESESKNKDGEISRSHKQIADLNERNDKLKASNTDIKGKLDEQVKATEQVDSLLNTAYADLKRAESEHKRALQARDDAEARRKETELKLESLHEQWEEAQHTIEELEAQTSSLTELENEHAALQQEYDEIRDRVAESIRTIEVKDGRIQALETNYQRALTKQRAAEDLASAAPITHDAEPQNLTTSGGESLLAELENTSDTSDFGGDEYEYEPLDYSNITEIVSIAPIDVPKLSIAAVQTTSVAPISPQRSTSSVQTEQRETIDISAQTDAPKLTLSIPQSAAIDTTPFEPKKALSTAEAQTDMVENGTSSTQTDITSAELSLGSATETVSSAATLQKTNISTIVDVAPVASDYTKLETSTTQTAPAVEMKSEPTLFQILSASQKWDDITIFKVMAVLFGILSVFFYLQLQAYKTSNGYGYYYSHSPYATGAFGNGRYLFGFIPVGFDIGHTWLSEEICRQTSTVIAAFEDWAGIAPTPLY